MERIPFNKWPLWAKVIAKMSNATDKGLGDTIARTIGPLGGDAWKKYRKGKCNCDVKQEELNKYQY
jgi:hypothetical protein